MAFRKQVTFILFSDFLDSLNTRLLKIISWVLSTSAKLKPQRAVNAWVWVSFRSTENSLYYSLCIMNFYFFSVAVLLCVVYPSGSSGLNHLCNIELFINLKNLFYPKNGRILEGVNPRSQCSALRSRNIINIINLWAARVLRNPKMVHVL